MFDNLRIILCRDDGRCSGPDEDGCLAQTFTRLSSDGDAQALLVKASIAPQKPLFKLQHGFARHGGVKLSLPLCDMPYLSVYQHKDWWIRPAFIEEAANIPGRTQLLLWQQGDEYHVLIGLCGQDYRADIAGEQGGLLVTLSSNRDGMMVCDTPVMTYAQGKDPFAACEAAVKFGLMLGGRGRTRQKKRFPPIFEKLGWCTWDAFYHSVDAEKIYQKLDELNDKRLPLGWVLIDDGWSDADYEKQELRDLDAVPEKFPGGLNATALFIKQYYGIAHVGVWQAMMGYWNGVRQGSPAFEALRENLIQLADGRWVPKPESSFAFWNTWHSYLARQGIDFVKIDQQSAPALFFGGLNTYGHAAGAVQAGVGASTSLHFNGNTIHCMGMAPEDLWSRPSAALIRSSDDFVPDTPDGFLEHCGQNVYGALLYGPLYWGDFDMFWSAHPKATAHAMLRAVSGGPVYISDKLGQTDTEILWPLISRDGTIYRCDGVALPTVDCLLQNSAQTGKPLKVWNTFKENFIVAAFSPTEDKEAEGVIRLCDIPKAKEEAYVCYTKTKDQASILHRDGELSFSLPSGGSETFLLVPLHKKCTVLGLTEKYLSCAAVEHSFYSDHECLIILKESGTLGFYMQEGSVHVFAQDTELPVTDKGRGLFYVEVPGQTVTIRWCEKNNHR